MSIQLQETDRGDSRIVEDQGVRQLDACATAIMQNLIKVITSSNPTTRNRNLHEVFKEHSTSSIQ